MKAWLRQHVVDGWLLFWLLPFIYFLLYGPIGFADTDQGFVPGLAWRVQSGQLPYLDFAYVRPPLTPLLHALELQLWPLEGQILGLRLDYYLMMWAAVAFAMLSLRRWIDFEQWRVSPWWLAALGFLFGVHNFPPTPWHTVDGLFFASLGLWLVTHPRARWQMALGLVSLAVAGLAKQPFALMFPVGMALLLGLQPLKSALGAVGMGLLMLAGMAVAGALVLPPGFYPAMMADLGGTGTFGEIFKAGFLGYLFPAAFVLAWVMVVVYLRRRQGDAAPRPTWLGALMVTGLGLLPFGYCAWAIWKGAFAPPGLGGYHVLWVAGLVYAARLWKGGNRNGAMGFLAFSALAWACSLSWGYAFPALFCLPGIVAVFGLAREVLALPLSNGRLALCFGVAATGFFALQLYPYRDHPRWALAPGAGEVFPALAGLRTSPENLLRMRELKALCTGKEGNFVVLPAQPGIHYLLQQVPVVGIDWEHDGEVGPGQMDRIRQEIQAPGLLAIVEKSRREEAYAANKNYASHILLEVLEQWERIAEGEFFDTYRKPGPGR